MDVSISALQGADGYAMATGDATGLPYRRTAIPLNPGMRAFPVDRESFVHLHVLAGLNAPPAKNALLRIITIEGIRMILLIRLGMIRDRLMFNGQQAFRAVDCAVAVVVVAHRAVKHVITEDSVECLSLRFEGLRRFCRYRHSIRNICSAGNAQAGR
jgi:hypothetical protein